MVRFAASTPALAALTALYIGRTGVRLSSLARLFGIRVSTMQRALGLLLADGVVAKYERWYRVTDTPQARASLGLALAFLPRDPLARAISANASLDFVGIDEEGIVAIVKRFPEPLDEARLRGALETLRAARPDFDAQLFAHHEVPLHLLINPSLRGRLATMTRHLGDPERYLPRPTAAGGGTGTAHGRLSPAVVQPDTIALRRFADRHGLRRIVAFGSAVRDDFRTTSDIDLLIEPVSGDKPGAFGLSRMVAEAQDLFDRDVDIVVGAPREGGLRDAVRDEGVVLHDAH
jgi:predicted nucleotidyltransferase